MRIELAARTDGQDRDEFPTMAHVLKSVVGLAPDRVALVCEGREKTYAEYGAGAAGVAAKLAALGLKRGDRVVVSAAMSVDLPLLILGAMAGGYMPAMVNPNYTHREMEPLLDVAQPAAVFCDAISRDALAPLAKDKGAALLDISGDPADWCDTAVTELPDDLPEPEDGAVLLYTGGTTGISKGVPHTHAEIMAAQVISEDRFPTHLGAETVLNIAPLFHIVGLYHGLLQTLYGRNRLVLLPRFHPDLVYEALNAFPVTVAIIGAPTAYTALMHHPGFETTDFSAVKFCMSGGGPMPESTLTAWEKGTGSIVLEGYGMSEGAPATVNPINGPRKLKSAGIPVGGIDFEIVDVETGTKQMPVGEEGEIRFKGPHVTNGYFNNPEATKTALRDGWLYTGDIAYIDEDNFVFIVDRKKDMAIVSGFNVYPREIDEVLMAHPKVKEAASVGVPDDYRGEIIKAVVVAKDGEALTEDEMRDHCAANLVKYKVPAIIEFVDEVPKTPVGKIDKKRLRA